MLTLVLVVKEFVSNYLEKKVVKEEKKTVCVCVCGGGAISMHV